MLKKFVVVSALLIVSILLSACDPAIPDVPVPTIPPTTTTTLPASHVYDLQSYYPNTSVYKDQYLEGKNFTNQNDGTRSVLWFEWQGEGTFRMYNSAPEPEHYVGQKNTSRCHYDILSWWNINGDKTLRYSKTHDECGATVTEIVYDPPIIFLPGKYDGNAPWSLDYKAQAKYYVDGKLSCVGVNDYTAKIEGIRSVVLPNSKNRETNLLWTTTQKTTWESRKYDATSQCSAGGVTDWKESYYLSDNIASPNGGVSKGLRRTFGGNADGVHDQWDVTFDHWQTLPKVSGL